MHSYRYLSKSLFLQKQKWTTQKQADPLKVATKKSFLKKTGLQTSFLTYDGKGYMLVWFSHVHDQKMQYFCVQTIIFDLLTNIIIILVLQCALKLAKPPLKQVFNLKLLKKNIIRFL